MMRRILASVMAVLMVAIGLGVAFALHDQRVLSQRLDHSNSDRDSLHRQLVSQQQASTALAKQVRKLGGTPVVTPSPVAEGTPDAGPQGADGRTGAVGPSGAAGQPGRDGSPGPIGPSGLPGATGAAGSGGTKGDTGATGPKGDTGDTGPAGATGPQGPAGPAGSVAAGDYSCPAGEYVTAIHVTADGTVSLDCGSLLAPDPEPSP